MPFQEGGEVGLAGGWGSNPGGASWKLPALSGRTGYSLGRKTSLLMDMCRTGYENTRATREARAQQKLWT